MLPRSQRQEQEVEAGGEKGNLEHPAAVEEMVVVWDSQAAS